jgi:UrcA family protein
MTRTAPFALAISGACLTIALPAAAQSPALSQGFSSDPSQVVTRAHVPYADVDERSAAGARILLQRIETAAEAVCGGAANRSSAHEAQAFEDCRSAAISGAVARARSPALAALTSRRQAQMRAAR